MQVAGAPALSPTTNVLAATSAPAIAPTPAASDVDPSILAALEAEASAPEAPSEPAPQLKPQPGPQHERPAFVLERTEPTAPLAQAAPESVAAAEPAPQPHELERASDILRQVRLSISPELRQATIQLSPLELGRISIRLTMHEGRVSAHVRAERPEALEALQRHMPELRAAFEARGLQAQELQLSLGFDGRERKHDAHGERTGATTFHAGAAAPSAAALQTITHALAQATSGVDTYA